MYISKKILGAAIIGVFIIVVASAGFVIGNFSRNDAYADIACTIDQDLLAKIYERMFHRPLDSGALGYVGHDVDFVLNELGKAEEQKMYKGMFRAMKAFEEAQRAPGELSEVDKAKYMDLIDSSMSTISAWSTTLPAQSLDSAVIGPDQARQSIQEAYERMNATAQTKAEFGLFQALEKIGTPENIPSPDAAPAHTASLTQQNNSGIAGAIKVSQTDGRTKITISLSQDPDGQSHPAHIHSGSCAALGGVMYPLNNVVSGTSETALTVGAHELFAKLPWAVNVHKSTTESNVYVACVDMTLQ